MTWRPDTVGRASAAATMARMMGIVRRAAAAVAFPFLAAIYPIVALYAVNLREMVPLESMLAPALVSVLVTAALLGVGRMVFGDWYRAGGAALVMVTLFFWYGAAWDTVGSNLPGGHAGMLVAWAVLAACGILVVRAIGTARLRMATPFLNAVLLVLVLGNAVAIGRFQLLVLGDRGVSSDPLGAVGSPGEVPVRLPDIYWIILDRYGSQDVLRDYYDFDIGPFLDDLRDRGFYVAEDAIANYLKTSSNVVAARNMQYLDGDELRGRATADDDWSPLNRDMLDSFRVLDILREHGYRFIYVGSHWETTASHPEADVNYVFDGARDEFTGVLSQSTLLRATEAFGESITLDWRRERWLRTHFQWDSLHDTLKLGSPKFVHAHFGLPHDPYSFEPDGSYVTPEEAESRTVEEGFANNVRFANASVLTLVDELLQHDPDNPPVIIIQADEGPYPERFAANQTEFAWIEDATDDEVHEKFGILSSFFLPGLPGERAEEAGLYPSISSVNEFRVIFNHYLGTEYELLPDRAFVWPDTYDIYEFVDVTDRVRRMVTRSDRETGSGQ